jgi:FkbM family methyltransferase
MSNRTTAVYLGDSTALTRTVFGHKLYVDTRDISLAPHLLLDGEWEMWITRVFRDLVRPGMTVVDIGANVGWYTLLAAQDVGPSGRVVAFEANPRLAKLVRRSVDVNGFSATTAVEATAVADRSGDVTLHVLAEHHGSSTIERDFLGFDDDLETLTVPATTLDAYVEAHGLRIDLLKIDAEGAEPLIISGARDTIAATPGIRILLEYAPANRRAVESLAEMGFAAEAVSVDSELVPVAVDQLDEVPSVDMVLFTRPAVPLEPPGVTLLAFADELLEHPAMLGAFRDALGDVGGATLVIYAPGADGDVLSERLTRAVDAAGLSGCAAALEAVAVPPDPETEARLAEGVDGVFTERLVTDAFAGLRAIGPDGLREFMPRHA